MANNGWSGLADSHIEKPDENTRKRVLMENQIEIYHGSDGQTQIVVKFEQETVGLKPETAG